MKQKLTLTSVKTFTPSAEDVKIWDTITTGFGLKITPKGKKVYFLKYRFGSRQRWYTIGAHGSPWTPDSARDEAVRLLGIVQTGVDPSITKSDFKNSLSISQLCDLYLQQGCPTKKASTLYADRSRIERHIKPLIGNYDVKTITKIDIQKFMQDIANGKSTLNKKMMLRTVGQ